MHLTGRVARETPTVSPPWSGAHPRQAAAPKLTRAEPHPGDIAPGGLERVELQCRVLLGGGDPGEAEGVHGRWGLPSLCRLVVGGPYRKPPTVPAGVRRFRPGFRSLLARRVATSLVAIRRRSFPARFRPTGATDSGHDCSGLPPAHRWGVRTRRALHRRRELLPWPGPVAPVGAAEPKVGGAGRRAMVGAADAGGEPTSALPGRACTDVWS